MTRLGQIFNKNTLVNCGDLLTVLYPSMCPPLLAITMWALTGAFFYSLKVCRIVADHQREHAPQIEARRQELARIQ